MALQICAFLISIIAWAEPTTLNGFANGTQLLAEQKYQEAADQFAVASKTDSNNSALYFNWGLAAYRLNQKGLATGLWRKALYLDPELSSADAALEFIKTELPFAAEYEMSLSSKFREHILNRLNLNKILFVVWMLMTLAGYLLVQFWGRYKKALREVTELPKIPTVAIAFSLAFLLTLFIAVAKLMTTSEIRATVTSNNAALRTGPSESDNSIFDLAEGADVLVNRVQSSWALVTISTGASGWVPTESLFQHTGEASLW